MTILLTGGTGKTSTNIARLLKERRKSFILASRSGSAPDFCPKSGCRFDWLDESTFEHPFQLSSDIDTVYMVAPTAPDLVAAMKPFTEYAIAQGVGRFVLLTSSTTELGGPHHGKVYEYLAGRGFNYAVLKPTWFMDNFSQGLHLSALVNEHKIYTAADNGKHPIVATADIAAVAAQILTSPNLFNQEYPIFGPELLSYDDIAAIFTSVLGKKVTHVKLTYEEKAARLKDQGFPEAYAQRLATGEAKWLAQGKEERLNDVVKTVTGKEPTSFKDWVEANKEIWL